jgi:hypothetical protein
MFLLISGMLMFKKYRNGRVLSEKLIASQDSALMELAPSQMNPVHTLFFLIQEKYFITFPVQFRDMIAVYHLFTPVCLFRSRCLGSFREISNKADGFTNQ